MDKTNIRPQFAAALGAELARLQRRVDGLSQRLERLPEDASEPDRVDAGLGARVDDLARAFNQRAQESAETRERLESLRRELSDLGAEVSALRRDLAGTAAPLEARLAELATRIPADPVPNLDDFSRGLDQVTREARSVGDRVMHLEGRLAAAEMMLGSAAADAKEDRLAAEQGVLHRRLDDLANALEVARGEAREQAERGRRVSEERQDRLRARAGLGLTLVALLGLTLLGALWWWTQSGLRLADGRLALLEAETAVGDLGPSPLTLSRPGADLADLEARYAELGERVDRLAARQGEAGTGQAATSEVQAAIGEVRVQLQRQVADAAALGKRLGALAALVEAQGDRLEALETQLSDWMPEGPPPLEMPSTADREPVRSPESDQAPQPAPAEPLAAAPEPRILGEERYVVQLIGFRSERSVAPFARRRGIAVEARYLRSRLRGQPWFEVVIGDYATASEAQAALAGLPEELRALDPVVRGLPAGTELLPIE